MNKLSGEIVKIESFGALSIVSVSVSENLQLQSIVIETPDTAVYLRKGNRVNLLFKETEVILTTDATTPISIENKLVCIITDIKRGKLLSEISLDCKGDKIVSIIPSKSIEILDLEPGQEIIGMVELNEIMIAEL